MHTLEILEEYGFKFFLCKADKTPDTGGSWKEPENHITREQAEEYQYIGRMIGAWIPENVIVIDIDQHPGKADGLKSMNEIAEKYNIPLDYIQHTLTCQTGGGGFHIFFTTDREFRQGSEKAPGIDLKTHSGYIIAAGSPGYKALNNFDPIPLPEQWEAWLDDCENKNVPAKTEPAEVREFQPVSVLRRILKKVDAKNFSDNGRWIEFVMSIKATFGDTQETTDEILKWSDTDPEYAGNHRQTITRINSTTDSGGITVGTFINYLKEEGVGKYLISQVATLDHAESLIEEGMIKAKALPFPDPDYNVLIEMSEATELLTLRGNTAAAAILHRALIGNVIYVKGENQTYSFDGSRWIGLNDYYNIIYTILFRTLTFLYSKIKTEGNRDELSENFYKAIGRLNDKGWKDCTWGELKVKNQIMLESVQWDSPDIMETVTCKDGVIDFSGFVPVMRAGKREEFRRAFLEYTTEQIMQAGYAENFNNFMCDLFPDEDTRRTAIYTTALAISGNPNKKRFQLFIGGNDNGKSTYVEVVNKILGKDMAYSYPASMLLQLRGMQSQLTPEMAAFQGKRFLSSIETDEGTRFSVAKIKQLTGGDEISANPKYRDPITFMPTWQLTLAVNDLPTFSANDTAFINRLLIIPFKMTYWKTEIERERALKSGKDQKYVKQAADKNKMVEEIIKERPAVIKFLIDKYVELQNDMNGEIPESAECEKSKQSYIKDNDDMGIFLDSCCEIDYTGEKGWSIASKTITEEFQFYVNNKKVSQSYVTRAIKKRTNGTVYSDNATIEITEEWGEKKKRRQKALMNIRLKDLSDQDIEIQEAKAEKKELTAEELAEKIPF